MNDEEKIQWAIDRIDQITEFLVDAIENAPRPGGMEGYSVIMCRPQGICSIASWLKNTTRVLATIERD